MVMVPPPASPFRFPLAVAASSRALRSPSDPSPRELEIPLRATQDDRGYYQDQVPIKKEGGSISHSTTDESASDALAIKESLKTPVSFARVFERHFASVHRYLWQRLGPDLADELAAETFMVAFDRRVGYDQLRPDARPWLLGIATNLLRHHWRAERRWLRACERLATESSETEMEVGGSCVSSGLSDDVTVSLRALTKRDREPLLLLAWAELTYEQIAVALDIPVGTVRSRINRARRQLKESLALPVTCRSKVKEDYCE